MKKFYAFCLLCVSMLLGVVLSSCTGKYDSLSLSASVSYSTDAEELADGTYRYTSTEGTFDMLQDGSYTMYISKDKSCRVLVKVSFSGIPAGFSYGLIFEQSNEILNILSQTQDGDTVRVLLSAGSVGQTKLTIRSAESDKSDSIYINVVEAKNDFEFSHSDIALTNEDGTFVDLKDEIVKNNTSDISFAFGYMDVEEFVEYPKLADYGLNFDARQSRLTVKGQTSLSDLTVRVTSTSPLGDAIYKYLPIHFVHAITDFRVYAGSAYSDVKDENLIDDNYTTDFVINYNSLNVADFLLVADCNGQEVQFSMVNNTYLEEISLKNVTYVNAGGEEVDNISDAKYAICHIRLLATSKTGNLTDKTFVQMFTCGYSDYVVEGYPLTAFAKCRVYDLPQQYSINGNACDNIKIGDNFTQSGIADIEVYINGFETYKGAILSVGLSKPSVLETEHSRFSLTLYNASKQIISSPENYFELYLQDGTKVSFNDTFTLPTAFYVKPSENTSANKDDQFYIEVLSAEPEEQELRVSTVVGVSTLLGIKSLDSIEYSIEKYELDQNGGYVINPDGSNKVINEPEQSKTFNNGVMDGAIDLDLSVDAKATVSVRYTPNNASLSAFRFEVENSSVAELVRSDADLNKFTIRGHATGSTRVKVMYNESSYYIPVNVFMPITNFFVLLSDSTSSAVASIDTAVSGDLDRVLVKAGLDVALRLVMFPADVTQYSLKYTLESFSGGDYLPVGEPVQVSYDDIASGSIREQKIKKDESFIYRLANNSFNFINITETTSRYRLTIELINLSGWTISKTVYLDGYNSSDISLSMSRKRIYNTESISVLNRIDLNDIDNVDLTDILSDPTCFGVKVTDVTSLGAPTYPFSDYGKISFKYNGMTIGLFKVEHGELIYDENTLDIIKPIYKGTIEGYYFFKLENTGLNPFDILVEASLQEKFSDIHHNTITKNAILSVVSANKVSSIVSADDLNISYDIDKVGARSISFDVKKDDAFNQAITYFPYRVYTLGNDSYFVYDEDFMDVSLVKDVTKESRYYMEISASKVGEGRIIVLPEDAILNIRLLQSLRGEAQPVTITSDEFVIGIFYEDMTLSSVATSYEMGKTYYIKAIDQAYFFNNFKVFREVYVDVNDGSIGNEYEISTYEELLDIVSSSDRANKGYKLVRDITAPSSNFTPLATYYHISGLNDYPAEDVYTFDGSSYNKVNKSEPFDATLSYFGYGFNGRLSGKVHRESITGLVTDNYYSINNVTYSGMNDDLLYGIFVSLGSKAVISELSVDYAVFTPSEVNNMTFGGLTAVNYGRIEDVSLSFGGNNTASITTATIFVFGGLVGVNYGSICNSTDTTLISCDVSIGMSKDEDCYIGGICGKNFGEIVGNFSTEFSPTFNDSQTTGIIHLALTSSEDMTKSSIGGAVGWNEGSVSYVTILGSILAEKFDNVGGLIGKANYSSLYNDQDNEIYSISYSYSTATVQGRNYVGGAIGIVEGDSTNSHCVALYYVSAENVVDDIRSDRTFVAGLNYVGGFVGTARYMWAKYCYTVTYFSGIEEFDVKSDGDAGAFACKLHHSSLTACASKVNVQATDTASIFVSQSTNSSVDSIIAYGALDGASTITDLNDIDDKQCYSLTHVYSGGADENSSSDIVSSSYIKKSDGKYYISIYLSGIEQPLFVVDDISIVVTINDNTSYINYLKGNQPSSLVLFYNHDVEGRYSESELNLLNTIDLFGDSGIASFAVSPMTIKTSRVIMTCYDTSILRINNDGTITLLKEGKTSINIASALNSSFNVDIQINVMRGVNYVGLFDGSIREIGDNAEPVNLLVGDDLSLGLDVQYTRNVAYDKTYNLDAHNDIRFRFKVYQDDLLEVLGARYDNINEIFKISSNVWTAVSSADSVDGKAYYYVDLDGNNVKINAIGAIDTPVKVTYTPFILVSYQSSSSSDRIFLDEFEKTFRLLVTMGATSIRLGDNSDGEYTINQHESLIFTVVINTNYDNDDIYDNGSDFTDDPNFVLTSGDKIFERDTSGNVISVSRSYTFSYKDKLGDLSESKYYDANSLIAHYVKNGTPLKFWASSQPTVQHEVYLSVKSKSTLDVLSAKLYSDKENDFPHKVSVSNVVYNETTALVSLEVYPYFATYSKIRVSYTSITGYPILITQVKYDPSNATKFSPITDGSTIVSSKDSILVDKSSGEDMFLANDDGIYSYGKTYFFSVTIPGSTPNKSAFALKFEVLNRNGNLVSSSSLPFIALVQPRVSMKLDESLRDSAGSYYLPIYTDNILYIDTINATGELSFDVSINDRTLVGYDALVSALTPEYRNNAYHLQVFSYESGVDLTHLIGKTVTISATMGTDYISSNKATISFVITMFTVRNVSISGVQDGIISLVSSNISPLTLDIDAYYDPRLDSDVDNWFSYWYYNTRQKPDDGLSKSLNDAGYVINSSFGSFIAQLADDIAVLKNDAIDGETSRVFRYLDADGVAHLLQNGKTYDDNSLAVEMYNNYFALYSSKVDRRYKIRSIVEGVDYSVGIANVSSYASNIGGFSPKFSFEDEGIVVFSNIYSFLNPIPVSSAEEFLSMEEGKDYRLVRDIALSDYDVIDCNMSSFDGNGYVIYIDSFNFDEMQTGAVNAGLFRNITEGSIVSNVTVYYTSLATVSETDPSVVTPSGNGSMQLKLYNVSSFTFGGLACQNYGAITNSSIKGRVTISLNNNATTEYPIVATSRTCAGFVTNNFGTITNSKVTDFSLSNYGEVGGFVASNNGRIVSSFVDNCSFTNLSNSNVGGFCYSNNGEILECYSQGKRSSEDKSIQNTASGISSASGAVAGFIYNNNGSISDCYSNIRFVSSRACAGFVYQESSASVISRCYSISYKDPDENRTIAFPFAGPTTGYRVEINGVLNDCYFLYGNNNNEYYNINFYTLGSSDASITPESKKASPLTLDEFATHTNFTSYDLSLDYKNGVMSKDEGEASYNYIDGYTWVIIEGKPVLASTLVPTLSLQVYQDKVKTYKNDVISYYEKSVDETSTTERISASITKTIYKNASDEVVYVVIDNSSEKTKEYTFTHPDYQPIKLTYSYDATPQKLIAQTYGEDGILDYEEYDIVEVSGISEKQKRANDKNFRASDTVEIVYDSDGEISEVIYKLLDSVQYSYKNTTGTRTNPNLVFDYDSFCYYFAKTSKVGHFYRFISNIDLNRNFTSTSYSTLSGVVEGNHMSIDNIYLSYTSNGQQTSDANNRSFGLFSSVSTTNFTDTVISNLTFNVSHVVSHTHDFVGVLAGQIQPGDNNSKIFISNLTFSSLSDATGVFGVHSVGALAGYASGKVVIKDITSSVSAKATYQQYGVDASEILYNRDKKVVGFDLVDVSRLCVAGGVIGIFDADKVVDESTFRNYNASNITISSGNNYFGLIAGSAFGVIGSNTIVNYVNVTVPISDKAYISSTGYAGGIVGENRGKIYSSSVTYENEQETGVNVHSSLFSRYNYFANVSTATTIAIGGLVGYNNGGLISNCITTLDVRNPYAKIAGGAVGRMSAGRLEQVIASGSVLAKSFMGGLVGDVVSKQSLTSSGHYDKSCIMVIPQDISLSSVPDAQVVITSCIAENNYLASDYNYYARLLNSGSANISSFIGLLVKDAGSTDYVTFDNVSFCVDGLVSSSSSSSIAKYLKPAMLGDYESLGNSSQLLSNSSGQQAVFPVDVFDLYYNDSSTGVSYNIWTRENNNTYTTGTYSNRIYRFTNSSSTSKLFTRELQHYDNFFKEIKNEDVGGDNSYASYIGRFGEIYAKYDGQYVKLDSERKFDSWGEIYTKLEGEPVTYSLYTSALSSSDEYYYTDDGEHYIMFSSVNEAESFRSSHEKVFYYLAYPKLDKIEVYKRYIASSATLVNDDISVYCEDADTLTGNEFKCTNSDDIDVSSDIFDDGVSNRIYVIKNGLQYALKNEIGGNPVEDSDVNSFVRAIASMEYVDINNIRIPLSNITSPKYSEIDDIKVVIDVDSHSITYFREDNELLITTFDGGDIYEVYMTYSCEKIDSKYFYTIQEVVCKYVYSLTSDGPVSLKRTTDSASDTYALDISIKEIVYRSFNNGYWSFNSSFYSSSNVPSGKYPINKEIAETYIWTSFIGNRDVGAHIVNINDAGDLSALAVSINSGVNYGSMVTINLNADIDLSGKYWVPIGTEEHPFTANFNGNGHTIKYATINEKSMDSALGTLSSDSLPKYAGVFGYVKDAKIYDLSVSGGQSHGQYAGGITGYAENTLFEDIINNNTAIGFEYSGGIAGKMEQGSLVNVLTSGTVMMDSSSLDLAHDIHQELFVGGIAGYAEGVTAKGNKNAKSKLANEGKISVKDNKTSYLTSTFVYIYCGGLFGKSKDNTIVYYETETDGTEVYNIGLMFESGHVYNSGKIDIDTNAYSICVGGLFGEISTGIITDSSDKRINTLSNISNTSTGGIFISYSNSANSDSICTTSFVGGIAGISSASLYRCNNEADIMVDVTNFTTNTLIVGGLAGEVSPFADDCDLTDICLDDVNTHNFYIGECFNFSSITLEAMSSNTTYIAGGLVGGANISAFDDDSQYVNIEVFDCYNIGNIQSSHLSNAYIAGLVGFNYKRDNSQPASMYIATEDISAKDKLAIKRCMNLANVYVLQYYPTRHVVASITAVNEQNNICVDKGGSKFCYNFYLKGTSYGGISSFNALGKEDDDVQSFALEKSSEELKLTSTFIDDENPDDDWDFEKVWEQKFPSWYPTLKYNLTSILWENRQESMTVENNVYLIDNADQLSSLAMQINLGYMNTQNVKFRLTSAIDLANRYWTPIGTESNPFRGSFDGAGFTVKNLTINGQKTSTDYGGLFGYIDGASIYDVGIENVIIQGVKYAGAVVCYATRSKLEKVYSDFTISNADGTPAGDIGIDASIGAGGLVYRLSDSLESNGLGLQFSYNDVPVTASSIYSSECVVGGLVGELAQSSISNCYNNYYGVVKASSLPADTCAPVLGKICDSESTFINIFSLANKLIRGVLGENCSPTLYEQSISSPYIQKSSTLPYYSNLTGAGDNSIADIWTNGYSLNVNKTYNNGLNAMDFPSIKGLNKEWKNALAEKLVGVTGDSVDSVVNQLLSIKASDSDSRAVAFARNQFVSSSSQYHVFAISSAKDLALLAKLVNSGASTSGNEYILLNDIDLSSMYWTPIGINEEHAFSGIFNFNGHVISNLTIDRNELYYTGLFGYTSKATIMNGYLDNVYIHVKNSTSVSNSYVGSLVGYAYNTNIYNVSTNVRILAEAKSTLYLGGLIGAVRGSSPYSIKNIRVLRTDGIDVTGYSEYIQQIDKDPIIRSDDMQVVGVSKDNNAFVGGVLGYISGDGTDNHTLLEYATSSVNIASICFNKDAYAGGIVSYVTNHATVNACQCKGQVKTYSVSTDVLGGIVGYALNSTISNCALHTNAYIEGRLQLESSTTYLSVVGGIVGSMENGIISYCANMGKTYTNYALSEDMVVGAIIGDAMRHDFSGDHANVYEANKGFGNNPVCLYKVGQEVLDGIFFNDIGVISSPNTIMTSYNQRFDSKYWDVGTKALMSEVVYVVGCADKSFGVVDPTDHGNLIGKEGLYIPENDLSKVKLLFDSYVEVKCIAYYMSGNYQLTSNETNVTSGTSVALDSLIDSNSLMSGAMIIYLTLVQVD